jgi:hypothetical protein
MLLALLLVVMLHSHAGDGALLSAGAAARAAVFFASRCRRGAECRCVGCVVVNAPLRRCARDSVLCGGGGMLLR